MGVNSQHTKMSLKFFFVFVLFIVSANCGPILKAFADAIGDHTDKHILKDGSSVKVAALAKNDPVHHSVKGSGPCFSFHIKNDAKPVRAKASGCASNSVSGHWNFFKKH